MARRGAWIGALMICLGLSGATAGANEPGGLFGRLFRGPQRNSAPAKPPREAARRDPAPRPATPNRPSAVGVNPDDVGGELAPIQQGTVPGAAMSPGMADTGAPAPRLVPQPRQSRPIVQAEPIVTRVALGRSDDGKQFAMFLQVFGDGSVIDTEGVHRIGQDLMRPLVAALQSPELVKPRTHCGGPATDFVEQVQVVVYRRAMGRLMANSFTYSGNTQGCDAAVRKLHEALDAVQNRISGSPGTTAGPAPATPAAGAAPGVISLDPEGAPPLTPPSVPLSISPAAEQPR